MSPELPSPELPPELRNSRRAPSITTGSTAWWGARRRPQCSASRSFAARRRRRSNGNGSTWHTCPETGPDSDRRKSDGRETSWTAEGEQERGGRGGRGAVAPGRRSPCYSGGAAKEACPKCGSSRRSEYWGRMVQRCAGLRADATLRSSDASSLRSRSGTPYTAIIRRRCLDCGQVRIDKEYA